MSNRFLRLPDVINKVGLSRSTLYAMIKNGDFPDKIKIGPMAAGWLESDIDKWIQLKIKQSRSTKKSNLTP